MFWNKNKRIYLDYAAAAPVHPHVMQSMQPYMTQLFYNPSALYKEGCNARSVVEQARHDIAKVVDVEPRNILFTNGGTESINQAMRGIVSAWHRNNPDAEHLPEILMLSLEHKAVRDTVGGLIEKGLIVAHDIPVDSDGVIQLSKLEDLLNNRTILVTCMLVNNEIGVIQPLRDIAKKIQHFKKHSLRDARSYYPLLHTDAIQASHIKNISMKHNRVDLMTLSSAKIGGPKAIGVLAIADNVVVDPIITGGGQENGKRSGTENVPYIVGLAQALVIAQKNREKNDAYLTTIRNYAVERLGDELKNLQKKYALESAPLQCLGNDAISASHILAYACSGISGEHIVIEMDAANVAISSQSACSVSSGDVPHVLYALGHDSVDGMIRLSFGTDTTKRDIETAIEKLDHIVDKLVATKKRFS